MTNEALEALKEENPYDSDDSPGRAYAWELGAVDGACGHGMTEQDLDTRGERGAYLDGRAAGADAAAEVGERV
jgi:hypothetical protein